MMRRNEGKQTKEKSILVGIGIVFLLIFISFVILVFVKRNKTEDVVSQPEETTEEVTEEIPLEEEILQEEIPEEEVIVYEAPEYEFKTEEFIIELPGISKEYTLAWISDVHMVTDREAADDVKAEFMDDVNVRYDMFKTMDEAPVRSADLWPEIIKYLNYNQFDGIVFGGDLMDYCSRSNMDAFNAEFTKLDKNVPMMYVRADHDYYYGYGGDVLTEPIAWQMHIDDIEDKDANDSRYLEFEDFVIIGINRSTKNMVPGYYDWVKGKYDNAVAQGKSVIIATHVPYESKVDSTLEELSMQVKSKIYYWGGGAYVAYEDTKAYFDTLIYSGETAVKSVVAGHLHHTWEGKLTENVNQHIFTPAFEGCIGIIKIKPVETE